MHIRNIGDQIVPFVAYSAEAVTPSDINDIQRACLYIGTGGDVVVRTANSSVNVTFVNVADGTFLPVMVTRILDTGTTASDILALR